MGVFCALHDQGRLSDEEIAKKLGFDSVEDMRNQLKNWNLPDWLIGEEAAGTSKTTRKSSGGRERRARGASGAVRELPPADNAAPLFQEKLEVLSRAVEELKHRKEKLHGKRFVQSALYAAPHHYFRELFSEEQWKSLSEHYGFEPSADRFSTSDVKTWSLGGGTPAPEAPLPALIGAYLLAGGEVEPLVKALHPDPKSADWSGIKKRVEGRKGGAEKLDGLKALTEQLAKAIRGGTLRSGSPVAGLSRDEINLACRITEDREAGMPEEETYEKLCRLRRSKEDLSWDEFRRLGDLELKWPWT